MRGLERYEEEREKRLLYYKKENKAWLREHVSHWKSEWSEQELS
jgi:hypothetical protein